MSKKQGERKENKTGFMDELIERCKLEKKNRGVIQGLVYIPNFLTEKEEIDLLQFLNCQKWNTVLKRRTIHFGYTYNYRQRSVTEDDYLGKLPSEFVWIKERIRNCGVSDLDFDQVIVNEYLPGQGIGAHIDQQQMFGPDVITISLGCKVPMVFTDRGGNTTHDVWLDRKSLALLSGDARYKWTHSITPKISDIDPETGFAMKRNTRVSITFRKVNK